MLERAKEFWRVAELALENELYNGCAANCYYAMFWAGISAMRHQGYKQEKWSHDGLRKSFNRELVLRRHVYPASFVNWLLDAYEERLRAHYKEGAGITRTKRLLAHTAEFIAKIEEVIKK